ncbi:glycine zipper 2TM domain-containing protein [Porphyrobacter algicida]|uniref:17 kDa surface antigen n=1 Tax=Qipengyuania algicida TaxID=1836209 RepID=A0A845AD13_9SPHN|nr:glycine zipper 2TM domain-containing protein [Qipengyuania algicida]MXP27377.1 glycine zipper 2TM domain-containing protein [Qipengyuania algicida]
MKKLSLALASAAMLATTATPALADPPPWAPAHGKHAHDRERYDRHHHEYHTTHSGVRYWRGNDGRYYCHRSDGTTGLLVGLAAGALVGRAIDTHGDRATGTILGAAGGALLGRSIDRGRTVCR